MIKASTVHLESDTVPTGTQPIPTACEHLLAVRDRLVDAEDSVCLDRAKLVTEAWREHLDEPLPLRRALALEHILRHMTLDVATNPFMAGNTSSRPRAWMLCPEYGVGIDAQVAIENDGLDGLLDHALPSDIAEFWQDHAAGGNHGVGHLAVDLDTVVNRGLNDVIRRIDQAGEAGDASQRVYRQAMRIGCRAVIEWAQRYAEAHEAAAREETDATLKAAHERVARACRHVPAEPARDLFEGLQAIALVQLAIHIEGHGLSVSVGLPDRALARFLAEAEAEPDRAAEHVAAFALCLMANAVQGRGSKTQAVTVGGIDAEGHDVCNAVTRSFLAGWELVRPNDPHLFLRWHERIDDGVKQQAVEMLSGGHSMPLLIHDEPTAAGFMHIGISREDAFDYCVIGCNELGIPGRLAMSAAPVVSANYLPLLRQWLTEHGRSVAFNTADELFDAFSGWASDRIVTQAIANQGRHERSADRVPTPFTSALMDRSRTEARDFHSCQTYRAFGIYERGLTNAANALAAIEQVVFGDRSASLGEVVESLDHDLPDGPLRKRLVEAPKFGNDDDRVDRWALKLLAMRREATDRLEREHGHPPYLACHVVRSLHRLNGQLLGATPDGRGAAEPLSDSIGAHAGTALAGPTAMLNSVLKIDAAENYGGGTNLNLTLSPRAARPLTLRSLIEAFFSQGGQELQIAVLDPATLREALDHPQRYRDLVVRIAGFNALWCQLSRAEREEIAARAEAAF